jgi:hypothetical protein
LDLFRCPISLFKRGRPGIEVTYTGSQLVKRPEMKSLNANILQWYSMLSGAKLENKNKIESKEKIFSSAN